MTTLLETDLAALARAWLAVDPDPATRTETERMLGGHGQELSQQLTQESAQELARVFGTRLSFGTAGLRGRLGTGPSQMNRVLVRVVAAAIADQLGKGDDPHMVVGYDARHGSADFALDSARVLVARGVRVTLLPGPLPTPLVAFAVRHLDADAGVMVTASHNPREDNGYKVYGRGGALITSPIDEHVAAAINRIPLLSEDDLAPADHPALTIAGDDLIASYIDTIVATLRPEGSRSARVAYTPIHGVGAGTVQRAFAAAGFAEPAVVDVQAAPDPDFATAAFPNPEESGVLDHLLALASAVSADVALANDPDADRLAVACRNGESWQLLSGDDLGCLLAEHLLARSAEPSTGGDAEALVINTVTSSRLLAKIADHHCNHHHRVDYTETLTGFKWIMHERDERPNARFVIGYEEALGYAVNDNVRDKDGISAALVVAELVSELRDEGRSLLDLLDDIHRRHGVHRAGQRSIRFETTTDATPVMEAAMSRLRSDPPASLAGLPIRSVADLEKGETGLPPTNGIVFDLDEARVVVRPSGTEPKMKVYVETALAPADDLASARATADSRLRAVTDAAVARVTEVERESSVASERPTAERAGALFADTSTGSLRADDLRLIVKCIDLTTLEGNDTPGRIRALCAQARRPHPADPTVGPTATVCVYPELVPLARELLDGTEVGVASVAGAFPSGLSSVAVRNADIADAAARGAHDIDIVLNRSAFLSGQFDTAAAELRSGRAAAGDAHLKVIIEVGELVSLDAIRAATRMAVEAGADFVKTSTGKTPNNASPPAVLAMIEEIAGHAERTGARVGIKIAGGVRTATDALSYVAMIRSVLGDEWLSPDLMRVGASSLLDDVLLDLAHTEARFRYG